MIGVDEGMVAIRGRVGTGVFPSVELDMSFNAMDTGYAKEVERTKG